MNLSAIHKRTRPTTIYHRVVCDIGGYEFVSYSQAVRACLLVRAGCLWYRGIWLCQLIKCKYKKNFLVGWVFALEFALDCVSGNCEILCKGHGLENAWVWGIRQYGGCQDFLRVQYLYLIRFFNPEKLYTPFTCTFKRLSFRRISVKGLGSKPYTQPYTNPSRAVSEKCSILRGAAFVW